MEFDDRLEKADLLIGEAVAQKSFRQSLQLADVDTVRKV